MRKVSRNQIPGKDHVTYTRYSLFIAFSRIGTTVPPHVVLIGLKFIYSEKATKFYEISTVDLPGTT